MKRLLLAVVLVATVPCAVLAQRPLPIPPVPPLPPTPALPDMPPPPPLPPAPVVAPVAPVPPAPVPFSLDRYNDWAFEFGNDFRFKDFTVGVDLENLKADIENMKNDIAAGVNAKLMADGFFYDQGPAIAAPRVIGRNADGDYQSGLGRLQNRQYQQAIESFNRVIAAKGDRVDGALYWKAFAEYRLLQSDNALASLATLRREHASSRYLSDAKVLEATVRRAPPASADDDEIKLLAIQGLSRTGEALPLLENVLTQSNSLGVKRRALYVLALSNDPKANDVLMRYARGAGNPDLQVEAIRYLGERSTTLNATQLGEIFASVEDVRVKIAVIDAYRAKSDKPALIKLAADRQLKADVRPHLFSRLNGLVTADDVMGLYKAETDAAIRLLIVQTLGSALTPDQLASMARTDADVRVRQRAINALGGRRSDETAKALVGLYQAQTDRDVRRSVINMLGGQRNAEALVALARQETDLELKRDLVRRLSDMASSNKAAADFLMEQLK